MDKNIYQSVTPIHYALIVLTLLLTNANRLHAQAHLSPPEARSQQEISSILAQAPKVKKAKLRELKIVLLAGKKDHGAHEHDYPLWQKNWSLLLGGEKSAEDAQQINMYGPANKVKKKYLKNGAAKVQVLRAWDWPSKEQFKEADLVVAFCVVHWNAERNAELKAYLSRGGGFVLVHQACVVGDGLGLDDEVAELIGLSWNWDYTRWRHGPLNLDIANANHPINLGLPKRMYFLDEAYWPLYGDRSKVDILATSKETDKNFALRDKDGKLVFSNMGAIQQKWPEEPTKDEPMFWTYNYGKGRVYGCILGHYDWTFDDPYFRIPLLRGMAWAAGESPYRFDPLVLRGATIK